MFCTSFCRHSTIVDGKLFECQWHIPFFPEQEAVNQEGIQVCSRHWYRYWIGFINTAAAVAGHEVLT
jgi:hypothetical protein